MPNGYGFCRSVAGESCGCPDCDPLPVSWAEEMETIRLERADEAAERSS